MELQTTGTRALALLTLGAALTACGGGGKPGWVKHQQSLLDDDVPAALAKQPEARAEAPQEIAPPADNTGPALPIGAADAMRSRCIGFTPDGLAGLFITEDRNHSAEGTATRIDLKVGSTGDAKGLQPAVLAEHAEDSSTEDVLGDGLQAKLNEAMPALNQQIDAAGLVTCTEGQPEADGGGQFVRKTPVVIAWPGGKPTRVTVRDGGVFVQPEGGGAREVYKLPEGPAPKLAAVWYLPQGPNVGILLEWESVDARRTELVFAPGRD